MSTCARSATRSIREKNHAIDMRNHAKYQHLRRKFSITMEHCLARMDRSFRCSWVIKLSLRGVTTRTMPNVCLIVESGSMTTDFTLSNANAGINAGCIQCFGHIFTNDYRDSQGHT